MIRAKIPSIRPDKRKIRIVYMRYADDFIILTNGKMEFGEWIKAKLEHWLNINFKLKLTPTKTFITNLK